MAVTYLLAQITTLRYGYFLRKKEGDTREETRKDLDIDMRIILKWNLK